MLINGSDKNGKRILIRKTWSIGMGSKYSRDFYTFMNIMYQKDFEDIGFNLTFIDLSLCNIISKNNTKFKRFV